MTNLGPDLRKSRPALFSPWSYVHALMMALIAGFGTATLQLIMSSPQDPVFRAEVILDDKVYPIEVSRDLTVIYPHLQHMALAQTPEFRERVFQNASSTSPDSQNNLCDHFRLNDRGGRLGPIQISTECSSYSFARQRLADWLVAYMDLAPIYRARKLISSRREELSEELLRFHETAYASGMVSSEDALGHYGEGISSGLKASLAADSDLIEIRKLWRLAVNEQLQQIAQSASFSNYTMAIDLDKPEVVVALHMVSIGRDDLFSNIQVKRLNASHLGELMLKSLLSFALSWGAGSLVARQKVRKSTGRLIEAKDQFLEHHEKARNL